MTASREQRLRVLIHQAGQRKQREFLEEVQPYVDELAAILVDKPPPPVLGPDGKLYEFVRPEKKCTP